MKNLRQVDLNLLIVFNALAEEEHLTRTAEKLHMSQPAVSNALARLRELLGDELFVRSPKGMRPTPRAKKLQGPIREALGMIEEQLLPSTEIDPLQAKNHFSLSMNGYAEQVVLPRVMEPLRQLAPHISLTIYPESDAQTPELLRSGELDLAIDYLILSGKDFIAEPFFEEELVVLAAKNHPKLSGEMSLEDYRRLPHVVLRARDHRGSPTEIILGRKQIKRNVSIWVSNLCSLPSITASSELLSTVPKRLAEHFSKTLPLEIYPLPFECERIPIYMSYHDSRADDPAHRWLREKLAWMAEMLASIP